VHLSLKSDLWWQQFNDFPENQLTKNTVWTIKVVERQLQVVERQCQVVER